MGLDKLMCPIKSGRLELICKLEDYRAGFWFNTGKRQVVNDLERRSRKREVYTECHRYETNPLFAD
jgi:hypothetical protein